jgi:hypothetical protein
VRCPCPHPPPSLVSDSHRLSLDDLPLHCETISLSFDVDANFAPHPRHRRAGKALLLFPALHPLDPLNKQVTSTVMNLEDKKHEGVWGPDGGTLIVIDGSWSQAKTIFKCTPILHSVPRVQFSTGLLLLLLLLLSPSPSLPLLPTSPGLLAAWPRFLP